MRPCLANLKPTRKIETASFKQSNNGNFLSVTSTKICCLSGVPGVLESIAPVFDEFDHEYTRSEVHRFSALPESLQAVDIIHAFGGLGLAGVLIAWVNASSKRSISLIKEKGAVRINASGISKKQLKELLDSVQEIVLEDDDI